MKRFVVFGSLALLSLCVVSPVLAQAQDVLGAKEQQKINFPPVAAGPGYILPDSPFYIVDKIVQGVKVAVALTPQRQAMTHAAVAQERLAELRIMVERGEAGPSQDALFGMTYEMDKAAQSLADAQAQGSDVSETAKSINDMIKFERDTLRSVMAQANPAFGLELAAARQSLLQTKVHVEDQLTPGELAAAVNDDVDSMLDTHVLGVETSATSLEKGLNQVQKRDMGSMDTTQMKGITDGEQISKLRQLQEKQKQLLRIRAEKLRAASEAARLAQMAAQRYKEAQTAEMQLQYVITQLQSALKLSPTPTATLTPSPAL